MNHEQIYNTFCKPTHDEIKSNIKEILHAIKGNGTAGLVTRVALLEQANDKASDKSKANNPLEWMVKNWQIVLLFIALSISTMNALEDNKLTKDEIADIIKQTKMLDENQTIDK